MENENQSSWNFRTIGFRVIVAYFLLYILPFPLTSLPLLDELSGAISNAMFQFTDSMYKNAVSVGTDPLVAPNGSGDTTYNYIQLYVFGILALFIALVWTIILRTRRHDEKLYRGLAILVRYYLAMNMIGYGLAKIFKTQFPFPFGDGLTQSYGDSSPMPCSGHSWDTLQPTIYSLVLANLSAASCSCSGEQGCWVRCSSSAL